MSFLNRVFGGEQQSAEKAKERLQLVLIHDRAGLSPGKLDALKDELIQVISRHIAIDVDSVEIALTNDRKQQRLVADIPLVSPKARR
ncbi:MAG: cell division topological specificity factor MinE [Anaerolineales bacterium]|jgi:cell division topological specificity factor